MQYDDVQCGDMQWDMTGSGMTDSRAGW